VGTTVVAPPFQFITCIKSPWPSILAAFVCWVYTAAPQITLGITPGGALGVTAQIKNSGELDSNFFGFHLQSSIRILGSLFFLSFSAAPWGFAATRLATEKTVFPLPENWLFTSTSRLVLSLLSIDVFSGNSGRCQESKKVRYEQRLTFLRCGQE